VTYVLTINVGGRKKGDIVDMAYGFCGSEGYQFEKTPEEVATALRLLDTQMAEWPWNLMGYDPATYGSGNPEDPSGLTDEDVSAVFMELAVRIAPNMGAGMSAEGKRSVAKTYSSASSRYAAIPRMPHRANTVRGSGAPYYGRWPYINGC